MPFSPRAIFASEWGDIRHFKPEEFKNPGSIGLSFIRWLDQVREQAGVPMHPTSDARTPEHNEEVGGAHDSAHLDRPVNACDFMPQDSHARFCIVKAALALGCTRLGLYPNGSIHLDRTEGERPAEVLWVVSR